MQVRPIIAAMMIRSACLRKCRVGWTAWVGAAGAGQCDLLAGGHEHSEHPDGRGPAVHPLCAAPGRLGRAGHPLAARLCHQLHWCYSCLDSHAAPVAACTAALHAVPGPPCSLPGPCMRELRKRTVLWCLCPCLQHACRIRGHSGRGPCVFYLGDASQRLHDTHWVVSQTA